MPYTDAFKTQMVKRMVGPSGVSAAALARQVGVSQPTLSQWLRAANRVAVMTPPSDEKKPAPPTGPKKWTAEIPTRWP
ncbi:transposase [Corallococcus terminator]